MIIEMDFLSTGVYMIENKIRRERARAHTHKDSYTPPTGNGRPNKINKNVYKLYVL